MKDSELNKQKRRFEKMITDKKVWKVEKKENKFFIYFKEGSVFKCSGFLPEDYGLESYQSTDVIKKRLF
jgi:alpha-tubulin suppressor-like RCC1 family protein